MTPNSAPQHTDVAPFDVDPTWRLLQTHGVRWFGLVVPLVAGSLATILFAWSAAELSTGRGGSAVAADLLSFLQAQHANAHVKRLPLLQDYAASILLFLSIPGSAAVVWMQLEKIQSLHSDLYKKGCLRYQDVTQFVGRVARLNQRLHRNGRYWWVRLLLCYLVAFLMIDSFNRPGFYTFLNSESPNAAESGLALYRNWWASPGWTHLGYWSLLVIGGYGFYLVATQFVVASLYTRFLYANRTSMQFRPTLANIDGYYGWEDVRTLVATVVASIVFGSFSCFALVTYMWSTTGPWACIAAVLLIVAPNVVGLRLALRVYRINVKRYREGEIRKLDGLRGDVRPGMTTDDVLRRWAFSTEIERVSQVPDIPFRRRTLLTVLTVTALPVIVALSNVLADWIKSP